MRQDNAKMLAERAKKATSWGSWKFLGHIERVLGASWRLLKASWRRLGSVLEVLEGVLEVVGDVLEAEMSQDCQERAKNKIP